MKFQSFLKFLFIGLLFPLLPSQSQDLDFLDYNLNLQYPSPIPEGMVDLTMYGPSRGWAIGKKGKIMATMDGGKSWIFQKSGTTNDLVCLHFLNGLDGIAGGKNGTILTTHNGGLTWSTGNTGTSKTIETVQFIDSLIGYAAGKFGYILKTLDGGHTWQTLTSQVPGITQYDSFYFSDALKGWTVTSNGLILATNDGGLTFTQQGIMFSFGPYKMGSRTSESPVVFGRDGGFARFDKQTQTWSYSFVNGIQSVQKIQFPDSLHGWVSDSSSNYLFYTKNGGISWNPRTWSQGGFFFLDSLEGFKLGGEFLYKSTSSGSQWAKFPENGGRGSNLNSIDFWDESHGWVAGYERQILQTTNGGKNWRNIPFNWPTVNGQFNKVHAFGPNSCVVVGQKGQVYKTRNRGISWDSLPVPTSRNLYASCFLDTLTGWVAGNLGVICKTTDGGNTWVNQTTSISIDDFLSIHFIDANTGWASTTYGKILRTSNGGTTWLKDSITSIFWIRSIQMWNQNQGWACTGNGYFMKTSNGGQNWTFSYMGSGIQLYSVKFLTPEIGFMVASKGRIFLTKNGGATWQVVSINRPEILRSIAAVNANRVWISGDNGNILSIQLNSLFDEDKPLAKVTGQTWQVSPNSDCTPGLIPIPYAIIKAEPGPYYTIGESDGRYNLFLPAASALTSYTIQNLGNGNDGFEFQTICPPSMAHQVSLDTSNTLVGGKNFGLEARPCHRLVVNIVSSGRRRCFKNSTQISYTNLGAAIAPNAWVEVQFPRWVRFVSCPIPHQKINDSTHHFFIGSVMPGASGSFSLVDSVVCGVLEILGKVQCTKAIIYPAPDCQPGPAWSLSEVSVNGFCENGNARLGIFNKTDFPMPDSVTYSIYIDTSLARQGKVYLAPGDSLIFSVFSAGKPTHLSVNQVPNHPYNTFVSMDVPGCIPGLLQESSPTINMFPQPRTPNSKQQCLLIRGSLDPNDKAVIPSGLHAHKQVPMNTPLDYLIRFQNTGTDTAFFVTVIDTLDPGLDPNTFQFEASSHPHSCQLLSDDLGRMYLKIRYLNILLPDSHTNSLASNGFFQYRISPKGSMVDGTKVYNLADIYFDYNPPVRTNRTMNTFSDQVWVDPVVSSLVTSMKAMNAKSPVALPLYPNPVSTSGQMHSTLGVDARLEIFTIQGKPIRTLELSAKEEKFSLDLRPGLYVFKIKTIERTWIEKWLVE